MSKTPKTDAAVKWLASAKKGETYTFWQGHLERACNTPENNMSRAERAEHQVACRAAKKAKKPLPKPPDLYKGVRNDARAMQEFVDAQELRGLIAIKIIVRTTFDRTYIMECIVQRNGLKAVRDRK